MNFSSRTFLPVSDQVGLDCVLTDEDFVQELLSKCSAGTVLKEQLTRVVWAINGRMENRRTRNSGAGGEMMFSFVIFQSDLHPCDGDLC